MTPIFYFPGLFMIFIHDAYSMIWPTYNSSSELSCYRKAAVSVDSRPCASIGKDILERNGSAVDAAIAMLVCLGASHPQSSGLGGGFLMVYYNRSQKKSYFIDAREVAPRKAHKRHHYGPKSIAVPGELAGYEIAHKLFGRLQWKELFTRTIKICEEGIVASEHFQNAMKVLPAGHKIRKMFNMEGNRFRYPKLAKTLREISEIGKKALYGKSEMARNFLKDLKAAGSTIDRKDMEQYKVRTRNPIIMKLKNKISLHTSALPGFGVIFAMMFGILDGYTDLSKRRTKNDILAVTFMHRFIEISKFADEYSSLLEDSDSDEMRKLINELTSKAFLDKLRSKINDRAASNDFRQGIGIYRGSHTTHLSVVAPNGDAVAVTSTINSYFGSRIVSSSTGIILNNQMADFSSDSSAPKNRIMPGKRPQSTMCPSIFTDSKGDVKLVIGASGGFRIATTMMQVAARVLYFGENIKESIDAPRFHADRRKLEFEDNFPREMIERLHDLGHNNQSKMQGLTIVQGIMRINSSRVCSNADYRKKGVSGGMKRWNSDLLHTVIS